MGKGQTSSSQPSAGQKSKHGTTLSRRETQKAEGGPPSTTALGFRGGGRVYKQGMLELRHSAMGCGPSRHPWCSNLSAESWLWGRLGGLGRGEAVELTVCSPQMGIGKTRGICGACYACRVLGGRGVLGSLLSVLWTSCPWDVAKSFRLGDGPVSTFMLSRRNKGMGQLRKWKNIRNDIFGNEVSSEVLDKPCRTKAATRLRVRSPEP